MGVEGAFIKRGRDSHARNDLKGAEKYVSLYLGGRTRHKEDNSFSPAEKNPLRQADALMQSLTTPDPKITNGYT